MTARQRRLPRPYVLASLATLFLTVVAAIVPLAVVGFYRDDPILLPQLLGQDLLTLVVAVPVFGASLFYAARGSLRGYVVWLGATGYLLYTYASYAFLTAFNELYLVYVALFGLIGGLARFDAGTLARRFGDRPVRAYVGFQALLAVLLALMWLSTVAPAALTGGRPPSIEGTALPTPVIQSLDLGVVVPAFALSAALLWRRRAWGVRLHGRPSHEGDDARVGRARHDRLHAPRRPGGPPGPDRRFRRLQRRRPPAERSIRAVDRRRGHPGDDGRFGASRGAQSRDRTE